MGHLSKGWAYFLLVIYRPREFISRTNFRVLRLSNILRRKGMVTKFTYLKQFIQTVSLNPRKNNKNLSAQLPVPFTQLRTHGKGTFCHHKLEHQHEKQRTLYWNSHKIYITFSFSAESIKFIVKKIKRRANLRKSFNGPLPFIPVAILAH